MGYISDRTGVELDQSIDIALTVVPSLTASKANTNGDNIEPFSFRNELDIYSTSEIAALLSTKTDNSGNNIINSNVWRSNLNVYSTTESNSLLAAKANTNGSNITNSSSWRAALDVYSTTQVVNLINSGSTTGTGTFANVNGGNITNPSTWRNNIDVYSKAEVDNEITDTVNTLGTAAFTDIGLSAGNIPVIGSSGKLNPTIVPVVNITQVDVFADFDTLTASSPLEGYVGVIPASATYIYDGADWQLMSAPTAGVDSFNGRIGPVVSLSGDYLFDDLGFAGSNISRLESRSHIDLQDIGSNSHDDIDNHINDISIHYPVDDASTDSLTSVWSASKLYNELNDKADIDGGNLSPTNITSWQAALAIGDKDYKAVWDNITNVTDIAPTPLFFENRVEVSFDNTNNQFYNAFVAPNGATYLISPYQYVKYEVTTTTFSQLLTSPIGTLPHRATMDSVGNIILISTSKSVNDVTITRSVLDTSTDSITTDTLNHTVTGSFNTSDSSHSLIYYFNNTIYIPSDNVNDVNMLAIDNTDAISEVAPAGTTIKSLLPLMPKLNITGSTELNNTFIIPNNTDSKIYFLTKNVSGTLSDVNYPAGITSINSRLIKIGGDNYFCLVNGMTQAAIINIVGAAINVLHRDTLPTISGAKLLSNLTPDNKIYLVYGIGKVMVFDFNVGDTPTIVGTVDTSVFKVYNKSTLTNIDIDITKPAKVVNCINGEVLFLSNTNTNNSNVLIKHEPAITAQTAWVCSSLNN